MTQPPRLRDHDDPELRELMRYAQGQGVPTAARVDVLTARVLAELAGSAGDGARAETSEAPGPLSGAGGVALKWTLCAVLVVAAGWGAYRLLGTGAQERRAAAASAPRAPVQSRPAAERAAPPVPAVAPPAPAREALAPAREVAPFVRPVVRKADARVQLKASAPRSDPGAEVALLQRARSMLVADPLASLALATQHRRAHPNGMFVEEREAIAVEALWRAGEGAQAETRLRALLRAFPRSTYRERLTALLGRSP